jgi:hypothetical protein
MCSDPAGLTASMLQKAASGQNINVGTVLLSRFTSNFVNLPLIGNIAISEDAGSAAFYTYTPSQLIASHGVTALASFGSCSVWACRGGLCVPDSLALTLNGLDAGSAISVSGPNGAKQLTKKSTGVYSASLGGGGIPGLPGVPPNYLDPGSYTVSGPGGSAVGSFNVDLSIPASPIQFQAQQNGVALSGTISESADLDITWTGGDPNGYAVIVGTSTTNAPLVTGSFSCVQKNSIGKFTVPSWVLSALPLTGTLTEGGISVSNGFLLMGSYPTFTPFEATGLDFGFADSLVFSGTNDGYQK